jgi:hypothetical protein
MPLYKVSGWYEVTKYVERIVEADSRSEAENKAWSGDYIDEIEHDEDAIGDLEITETEEIE